MSDLNKNFNLDYSYAASIFPIEEELLNTASTLFSARNNLLQQRGDAEKDTAWLSFMEDECLNNLIAHSSFVHKIRSKYNAIVIIAVGGSVLGLKAVYHALTNNSFYRSMTAEDPTLFWAGNHLDSEELSALCINLNAYSPALLIISKSGDTLEPALSFRILHQYLLQRFTQQETKERIFVVTNPNNGKLLQLAQENNYQVFHIPPGIGGRYCVFTPAGLLALAIAGIDVKNFVLGGQQAYFACNNQEENLYSANNYAILYAGMRNILYQNNYKIEAICTWAPKINYLAQWWQQLFGESDAKEGSGIFPACLSFTADLHSLGQYLQEGERQIFTTHICFSENKQLQIPHSNLQDKLEFLAGKDLSYVQKIAQKSTFLAHTTGKVPILIWNLPILNAYWLGYWMFSNMFACAVGAYARKINPFNQPGVEQYKRNIWSIMLYNR